MPARASASNTSSPLSDVEDKDADVDAVDMIGDGRRSPTSPAISENVASDLSDNVSEAPSKSDSDEDSNLSELEVDEDDEVEDKDSEAETERLFQTPQKRRQVQSVLSREAQDSVSQPDAFDPAAANATPAGQSIERLSGLLDLSRHDSSPTSLGDGADASSTQRDLDHKKAEQRKRKRSQGEADHAQPVRKRTNSKDSFSREDEERHDEGSDVPARGLNYLTDEQRGWSAQPQGMLTRSTRSSSPVESAPEEEDSAVDSKDQNDSRRLDEGGIDAADTMLNLATAVNADGPTAEDEIAELDGDDEIDTVHKTEEELERRKLAWEQLTAIEKQFAAFRDRLYQERLDQLSHEEALLAGDDPTHPEYLAMLQCIEGRREERVRILDIEYRLRLQVLRKRATAERAQILSQFFQTIRESREKALEDLGRQWYDIQHQRRRYVNTIPEYGLRYPTTMAQNVRNAIAYNKEVSILSGIAKYRGFPAAPDIRGADANELDEDLEAITRARRISHSALSVPQPPLPDYGGIAVGHALGPAAEQFLEQTPWANPNHPSHQSQRQNSLPGVLGQGPTSALNGTRMASQVAGPFETTSTSANSEAPLPTAIEGSALA